MLHRKTVTLVEEYDYISREDDAVNRDDPAFDEKWEQYLDGQTEPPLLPGAKPTIFRLRHLNTVARTRLMRYIAQAQDDASRWPEALVAAFVLGVVGVENYSGKEGKPLQVKPDYDDGLHHCPILSAETVNEFEAETVLEVGGRVLSRLAPSPK